MAAPDSDSDTNSGAGAHPVLACYDRHAAAYAERTWPMDMGPVRARFQAQLAPGAHILDAGCGSGRDALAFVEAGFRVTAIDGSCALAQEAHRRTGLPVRHQRFDELDDEAAFDAVWACASLVHLSDAQMHTAVATLRRALRPAGILFMCVKEGRGARVDPLGRPFNDFTKERLRMLLRCSGFSVRALWRTSPMGAQTAFWLNALAMATATEV